MSLNRPRILAFAYACEPDKGSEPGAGWTWARMLAAFGDVVVVTRTNNRESIERALVALHERHRLRFVYVDLPRSARWWKRGQRGVRLYYVLWQLVALRAARRLSRAESFDLYWHLTFANGWIGTLAPLAGRPFVYGPVGGGTAPPWRLLPSFGRRGVVYELVRAFARLTARYLNPLARLGWTSAALVLAQNPDTFDWLPRRVRRKAAVFPNATLESKAIVSAFQRPGRRAIFAGRLLPLKGLALALPALARTDDWTLTVCGDGPDRWRLASLSARLGLDDRVSFLGWRPRSEVLQLMRDADLFLFPSLHDESPFAVADALACGLPIVCLPIGGSAVLGERAATVVSASGSATDVATRLAAALRGPLPPRAVATARARELTIEVRAAELLELLTERNLIPSDREPVAA
jgi:glycosyltransferase involved in cell wall biosynthesis